jgi:hypothetical protein
MPIAAYVATYLLAWAAALVTNLLAFVHWTLAFIAPAAVAEFLSRSYVFSGLCLVLVAIIANGTKLYMWRKDNSLRRERDRLLQEKNNSVPAAARVHPTENA